MDLAEIYQKFLACNHVVIDSRHIAPGAMFFGLQGAHFNGSRFAHHALEKGARYAVVDDPSYADHPRCLWVENSLQTLQQLAQWHRRQCNAKVLAITGSNGKTTTKELIHQILGQRYTTLATEKNYNNHIGVPLTLLQLTRNHQYAVVEMGANHPGEIGALCRVAEPDFGIITNIGKAHLEGFGSFQGVVHTKKELYDHVCAANGVIFYNSDQQLLCDLLADKNCLKYDYGTAPDAWCQGSIVDQSPFLTIKANGMDLETCLMGDYNFENLMAGICVAKYLNIPRDALREAIENYVPDNNRSQLLHKATNEIILDAYNANPTSMQAALENFSRLERPCKVAILGDMFELGQYSQQEHHHIVRTVEQLALDQTFLIGEAFYQHASSGIKAFRQTQELIHWLKDHPLTGCTILIKGSRGMALERLIDYL